MPHFFEFVDVPEKATSGWLRNWERGIKKLKKKLVPTEALNEFWRAGRGALDALALGSGIPLSNLRQQYRSVGIDPDKFDAQMDAALEGVTEPTAEQWQEATEEAETKGKLDFPILAVTGVILGSILLFSQRKRIRHGFRTFRAFAGRRWAARKIFKRRHR